MIFQRDVLEELEVPLEMTSGIASCFMKIFAHRRYRE